jgi:hypothetical protein
VRNPPYHYKTRAIHLNPTKINHSQPPVAAIIVARKAAWKKVLRI